MIKLYPHSTVDTFYKKIILFTFLLIIKSFATYSQAGVLDVTFGDKGKVISPEIEGLYRIVAFALKEDGKIVSLLDYGNTTFAIVHHNKDGSIDSTFGDEGILIGNAGYLDDLAMQMQKDEKIIVSGFNQNDPINMFKLYRYNADGSLDISFGLNGNVIQEFLGRKYDRRFKVAVRPNGKILVAGELFVDATAYVQLVQLNEDGSIDSSFGVNGRANIVHEGSLDGKLSIKFYNEKTILAHSAHFGYMHPNGVSIRRLNANGSIDSTFGNNGHSIATLYGENDIKGIDMAIQPDAKIVVLADGNEGNTIKFGNVLRFNSDGTIDQTFANNGSLFIQPDQIGIIINTCNKVHILPDDKILITGAAISTDGDDADFFLSKYTTDGKLDSSFGRRGFVLTDFFNREDNVSVSSVIQRDGKIILGGYCKFSRGYATNVALARYEQNALVFYNTLKGSIYFDQNKNGIKDNTENYVNNAEIVTTKAHIDTITMHTQNGLFTADIDTGSYVSSVAPYLPYYTAFPATYPTSHTAYFNTDNVSFALQPISAKRDLAVSLIAISPARPGFPVTYKIIYTNQGTDTITTGTIEFIKNRHLLFSSSLPAPANINGDTLRWSFSNLKPMETASIVADLAVSAPPAVNVGDTLRSVANIFPLVTDLTRGDNQAVLLQRVVGSFDPNDKTENHAGSVTVSQVQTGEDLQYTIRFQNTGTDTAFNVFIRDTLDNNVDWSTLKIVASSHNFLLSVNDGRYCNWGFNKINLPDSNTNEAFSHGYIVYSVKANKTLGAGDAVNNTAYIYFDYNLPVQTNMEKTIVENLVLPIKLLAFAMTRKGKTNIAEWQTAEEVNVDHIEIQRSTNGSFFTAIGKLSGGVNKYAFTDDTPPKTINYYRLKMVDKDGKYEYSFIRSIDNRSYLSVDLYPNPTIEKLALVINTDEKKNVQLQIIGMDGKVLLLKSVSVQMGQQIQPVDVSVLQSGSYFLKVSAQDNTVLTVIKFEKM